jgi:type IV secretory pathway VirB2 component (pilin)
MNTSTTTNRLVTCIVLSLFVLFPDLVFAQAAGGSGTLDAVAGPKLCLVVNALTGTTGRAIATIGIIILGIGAFFGKVNWGLAILVAIGVISIFAAAMIVAAMGATGADCSGS